MMSFLLRFGSTNARVGGPNLKLTRVNDKTVEIMLKARDGKFEGGADTYPPEYSSVSTRGALTIITNMILTVSSIFRSNNILTVSLSSKDRPRQLKWSRLIQVPALIHLQRSHQDPSTTLVALALTKSEALL